MPETPHNPQPGQTEYEKFVQQIAAHVLCEDEPFQKLLDQLRELYSPANVQEEFYLTQLAQSQLNVQRVGQLQAGLYTRFVLEALNGELSDIEAYPESLREETPINREQRLSLALADSFTKNARNGKVLGYFSRFLTEAKRNLRRDQEQFDRIRKQQNALSNLAPLKPPSRPEPEKPEDPPNNQKPKVRLLSKTGKPAPARKRSKAQASLPSTVSHVVRRLKSPLKAGADLHSARYPQTRSRPKRRCAGRYLKSTIAIRPGGRRHRSHPNHRGKPSRPLSARTNNLPLRGSQPRAGPGRTRSPAG